MTKRDDFKQSTKALLARRVAYRCSHPECRRPTIGPAAGSLETVSLGEAAHITAAAPGGPRYDASLTPTERSAFENGIWMCALHAKQIDSDDQNVTVAKLREWKNAAEKHAFQELTTGRISKLDTVTIEIEAELLERLGLLREEDEHALAERARQIAKDDLATFTRLPSWPRHAVALRLHAPEEGPTAFNIVACSAALSATGALTIVSPPGTGKSTALVQLTQTILEGDGKVAALVPLSEWSTQPAALLTSLTHRAAFRNLGERDLIRLALHGRLVLTLDGWNELDAASKQRAANEITRLRREFPLLEIVVSTRRQALDVPLPGPVLEILPLDHGQQLEVARAALGAEGEALLDHAWRLPGLRELVSIPLYLNALLAHAPGGAMPTTKEEVIRLFVEEHERSAQNAQMLHDQLHGVHRDLLVALAVEATTAANTAILETSSRQVISAAETRLQQEGQITLAPQPARVIETLVSHHTLTRGSDKTIISFQHQQIQEWYASFEVESVLLAAASGDADRLLRLRSEILDRPSWEEAILFCCERLSRASEAGSKAVAFGIGQALSIDPILAADMIFRASDRTWDVVKEEVTRFASRWHTSGRVDRAARFMITTGKAEFADQVWALVDTADNQSYLGALRCADRFRPSVLGADAAARLARLADDRRGDILASIADESAMDGMELAAEVAATDPDPEVQCTVIEALLFRRSDRLANQLLHKVAPETWRVLAQKGLSGEITDAKAAARLEKEEREIFEASTDLISRLRYHGRPDGELTQSRTIIEQLVADAAFPADDQNARAALTDASQHYPGAVAAGLQQRLARGLLLPYGTETLLDDAALVDDGPIAALFLDGEGKGRLAKQAAHIIGPSTIGSTIDRLLALHTQVSSRGGGWLPADKEARRRYEKILSRTRAEPFVAAWLARSNTQDAATIATLADLICSHGRPHSDSTPFQLNEAARAALATAFNRHADALLASHDNPRYQAATLARAMGRLGSADVTPQLERLADQDLRRWREARDAYRRKPTGHMTADVSMKHVGEYTRALATIGDAEAAKVLKRYLTDDLAGSDAAIALMMIWNRRHAGLSKDKPLGGINWSVVSERRRARAAAPDETSPHAEDILDAAAELLGPEATDAQKELAIELAAIGVQMPYGQKSDLIATLLSLDTPILGKKRLLTSLVLAGEVISADVVLGGIRAYLDKAKSETWMLDRNSRWSLLEWLSVLPFTDRPSAVLEALGVIPEEHYEPWELRGLFSALQHAPSADVDTMLFQLVEQYPRLLTEDWLQTVIARQTTASALGLLDGCGDASTAASARKLFGHHSVETLGQFVSEHPAVRLEFVRRYQDASFASCHPLIESVLARCADADVVEAMVRRYTETRRRYDHTLERAIEKVALAQRPAADWINAYHVYPVAVSDLRRNLHALIVADGAEAELARCCLEVIDRLRDERGRPEAEPRHPDIRSNRPWPLLR